LAVPLAEFVVGVVLFVLLLFVDTEDGVSHIIVADGKFNEKSGGGKRS
jgi:hypothetical protein